MKKIKGIIKITRPDLSVAAGICVLMGQLLALGEFAPLFISAAGFFSVFSVSASILVLNDYFDVETDRINAPQRPIPSGAVSEAEALVIAILLLSAGMILSALINIWLLLIAAALAVIGFLYNRFFKKSGLTGNLMVSFSVGMTFIYGGASVGIPFHKAVLFFAVITALVDLGEEIAADALDAEGDKLIGSASIAIRKGERTALNLSAMIFFTVTALSFLPFVLEWFAPIYLIPILFMNSAIVISAIKIVKGTIAEKRKYIRVLYLGATSGLLLFLIMRLFGV